MKKTFVTLLVGLSLVLLIVRFGAAPLKKMVPFQARAGLKITSVPEASVVVNGGEAGRTPYLDENLTPGEYDLRLSDGANSWRGKVDLNQGTLAVVNRELAPTIASSSGEVLTLYPGSDVVVTSNPIGAEVEVDGKTYGKTPLTIKGLEAGEYTFILSHENYLRRSVRATLPGKLSLHLNVDLSIVEADLEAVSIPQVQKITKVTIKQTPTGFLRVRGTASTKGAEVGRVSPGDNLVLIEELNGWVKIRLDDGTEGYVSSQYIQKE